MNEERWTALSFRIRSGTVSARHIERLIGSTASVAKEIGERVSQHSIAAGVHDKAVCIFRSPVQSSGTLEAHVTWLMEFLTEHEDAISRMSGSCEFDARIGFSAESGQGGFALSSAELEKLGKVGIGLFIDLYPADSKSSE